MRTNMSNSHLPGIQCEDTLTLGKEIRRTQLFRDGEYAGEIIYVARRKKAPAGSASATGFVTEYGWRPARSAPQSRLMSGVDAARIVLSR